MDKKTALYCKHIEAGGKLVPFAGYQLPVQYKTGIITEHKAVRERAGMFDVSHMGEFRLTGPVAVDYLNYVLTNDFTEMDAGQVRYSPMCYPDGGTADDLLVYKIAGDDYLIVVNAANRVKDYEWMSKNLMGGAKLEDISDSVSQIALQGPCSADILKKVADERSIPMKYYRFVEKGEAAGMPCLISRTGYTGENGFELYCENRYAEKLWDALMAAGDEYGLIPCGLGSRDTLRLEAAMPLYGHELSEDITPKEAGLSMFVKTDKQDFIGKEALDAPAKRKRIGIELKDRGIAREGAKVMDGDECVGVITSGTMSPTLSEAIAMALVDSGFEGDNVEVEVRGKMLRAEVVKLPFYSRSK